MEYSSFFSAAGTDDEVIVVARRPNHKDACGSIVLAFRPSSHSWREVPAGPAGDRVMPVVAWTGSELFVGGGRKCGNYEQSATADLLDPVTGTWRRVADAPIGFESAGRYGDLWTGRAVATITGTATPLLFDPQADTWHMGDAPWDDVTLGETPYVWVGNSIVVWSGGVTDGPKCCNLLHGGISYMPPPGW
jgi:hypothetical protein